MSNPWAKTKKMSCYRHKPSPAFIPQEIWRKHIGKTPVYVWLFLSQVADCLNKDTELMPRSVICPHDLKQYTSFFFQKVFFPRIARLRPFVSLSVGLRMKHKCCFPSSLRGSAAWKVWKNRCYHSFSLFVHFVSPFANPTCIIFHIQRDRFHELLSIFTISTAKLLADFSTSKENSLFSFSAIFV